MFPPFYFTLALMTSRVLNFIISFITLFFKWAMEIKLLQGVENKRFVKILIDDEPWRLIDKQLYKSYLSKIIKCQSKKELAELFQRIEGPIAKELAYRLLAFRGYMKKELKTKLEERKISYKVCLEVIDTLEKRGYLDDEREAKLFIESKLKKGLGPLLVKQKLLLKLGSEELCTRLLKEKISEQGQQDAIQTWIEKKYGKCDLSKTKMKVKIYRFLRGKGFENSVIQNILFAD